MNYCPAATKLEVFPRQVYRIYAGYAYAREYFPSSKSLGKKRAREMRTKQFRAALSYF